MKYFLVIFSVLASLQSCKSSQFTGGSTRSPALPPIQVRQFVQDTREVRQVQVKQGSSGSNNFQDENVTAMGIVDIVVVVDNSSSMKEEQTNLSSKMAPLLSAIKDSNWQILVTSTSPNSFYRRGPYSKSTPFYERAFSKAVIDAGLDGGGLERPMLRAVDALRWSPFLSGGSWLRSNSTVAVVILTDEDNCHLDNEKGYGCSGFSDASGTYLTNYLSSIRTVGTDARVYGIFWHPSQAQAQCSTALKQATVVADVVQRTGGTWGSICDADYSATLSKISNDVAKILKADFQLKNIPDQGTFRMTVNGQPWTEFELQGLRVRFTRKPSVGSTIRVQYRSGAFGEVTNRFNLPEAPAEGVVTATIGGQQVGNVTYDAEAGKAVFAQMPPDGSNIILSYKVNSPLKTDFEIAPNADTRFLKVFVNGSLVDRRNYTYSSTTGTITFKVPPPESANIKVEWRGRATTT